MLLVQKGNWNFPVAELVGTIVCVEREAGFYYCECEKLKWRGTLIGVLAVSWAGSRWWVVLPPLCAEDCNIVVTARGN